MEEVGNFIKQAIELVKKPYMRTLPGQLAFFTLMSLIPLIAVIGSLANTFSLSLDMVENTISNLPMDLTYLFSNPTTITAKGLNFNMVIFFITAFLLASNGMHSVIITANEIHEKEDEGMLARRLKAIAMTFVVVGLLFFLIIYSVFGNLIFTVLNESVNNIFVLAITTLCFKYLKIPIILIFIFINLKQLYKMVPD